MVGQFGGPCFDAISNQWTASLQVEADGSIEIDDEIVKQLRHLAPEREQILAVSHLCRSHRPAKLMT